jgi:Secretion system C-terminal sorting domain
MSRLITFMLFIAATVGLGFASQPGVPYPQYMSCPVNSAMIHEGHGVEQVLPALADWESGIIDSNTANMHVLLFNYSAYDHGYAEQMHRFVQRALPGASLTNFWEGTSVQLAAMLAGQHVVVITYPADGESAMLRGYGVVLEQFIQKGGEVIFSGTHRDMILRSFGLLDIDYARSMEEPTITTIKADHPLVAGLSKQFSTNNFAYPLDVSDPNFVTVAEIQGSPVVGYKSIGLGRVIYLGLEYYDDEPSLAVLLSNALLWAMPAPQPPVVAPAPVTAASERNASLRRNTEMLYTGNAKPVRFNAKVYPNPYIDKSNLEIEVLKSATFTVEMTDESGRPVALLLPQKQLLTGTYRIELPNVEPGVYIIQCKAGDQTEVRKVVKLAGK